MRALLCAGLALLASGCAWGPTEAPLMGSARITTDFASYEIHRVGIVPFRAVQAAELAPHEIGEVETAFHAELATATPYDLVPLRGQDLEEVLPPDPFRENWYTPETIRTLRDRYRLDALIVGTITSRDVVSPQVLGTQLDLVSCETGATIWSADLLLDASREDVREAVQIWATHRLGDEGDGPLTLLSPQRFARFAAYEMARLL